MIFRTMYGDPGLVWTKEVFPKLPVPYQYQEIIEDTDIFLCFLKTVHHIIGCGL